MPANEIMSRIVGPSLMSKFLMVRTLNLVGFSYERKSSNSLHISLYHETDEHKDIPLVAQEQQDCKQQTESRTDSKQIRTSRLAVFSPP